MADDPQLSHCYVLESIHFSIQILLTYASNVDDRKRLPTEGPDNVTYVHAQLAER